MSLLVPAYGQVFPQQTADTVHASRLMDSLSYRHVSSMVVSPFGCEAES